MTKKSPKDLSETSLPLMPTNAHPECEYEHAPSRFLLPSVPLSRQVMNQVYSGMSRGGMTFNSHLTDPKDQPDSSWPDTDDRFGSLLKKGNR